jgi:hypothetical protein
MGIGHLLDHTCNVWRLVRTKGDYHETVNTYERVYDSVPCTAQRRNTTLGLAGPGEKPVGDRRIYLDTGPLFEDNDVVSIVAGPTGFVGPQNLQVESVAVPRGHHIELRGTEWSGALPDEEGS